MLVLRFSYPGSLPVQGQSLGTGLVLVLRLLNIHPLLLLSKWAIVSIIKIIIKTRMLATIPVPILQNIPGTQSLIRG